MFTPKKRTWFPVRLTAEDRKHEQTYAEMRRIQTKWREEKIAKEEIAKNEGAEDGRALDHAMARLDESMASVHEARQLAEPGWAKPPSAASLPGPTAIKQLQDGQAAILAQQAALHEKLEELVRLHRQAKQ